MYSVMGLESGRGRKVYNNREISTFGEITVVHSVQSTMMGRS